MSFAAAATLSSGLLVRKGAAIPTTLGPTTLRAGIFTPTSPGATSLAAVPTPPRAVSAGTPASGGPRDHKVSLRLDAERHRKLRLATVHLGRSGQSILLEALDAHLARCADSIVAGDCACLLRKPGRVP